MSFTLNYTGDEINAILARANNGGEIDDELALKAPLASPALTGNPTAPTQPEEDNSTKIATTEYADRAADAAEAAAEAAAKEYTDAATGALYITDTASGSIANFSDGADGIPMRSVKAQIEPVQDLHGQDAPYPPGGGKNKAKTTLTSQTQNGLTFTVNTDGSISVSGTATAMTTLTIVSNLSLTAGEWTLSGAITNASIFVRANADMGITGNQADTGSGKTFTVTAAGTTTVAVQVGNGNTVNGTIKPQVESGSTATSYAPYSNECPISGWTGAEVNVTAVNIYDQQWELGSISATTGELTASSTNIRSKDRIPVYPSTAYRFLFTDGATNVVAIHAYDADDNWLGMYDPGQNAWRKTGGSIGYITAHPVFTTPANTAFIRFRVGGKTTYTEGQISINTPSTVTDYMPFGTTYPVTWETQAGTVYGGTIDVVSGELKVTHKSVTYTGASSESWSYGSNRFRISVPDMVTTISPRVEVLSNIGVYAASGSAVGTIFGSGGDVYYYAPASITTVTDYRTWLASNNLQVMYPLAQPVIYRLSAQQITSLLGQNNVWSNTGDTEVEYVADPKLYIAKMLGGGTLTLGSVSPLSINRPATISEEDLEQAGEVSEAVEAATETVLPAESGETEEEAQE